MSNQSHIIFCHCTYYNIVPKETKAEVLKELKNAEVSFEEVTDICELATRHDETLNRWAKIDALTVIACYRRTIKWLFFRAGANLGDDVEVFNMRTQTPETIVSSILKNKSDGQAKEKIHSDNSNQKGPWIPWFPVIDYDRCENCKQCLNFCLFGVYALDDEGKVEVQNPANCKTNCPACARICSQAAIIFPKYDQSPINGDEVNEETLRNDTVKVDLKTLLNGDIHEALRQRSKGKKRFAKDSGDHKRLLRLAKFREQLDIPDEVLASLSPSEILQADTNRPSKAENTDNE